MNGKTPLEKLNNYGFNFFDTFSMFPILILDNHSTNLVKNYDSIILPGNNLLTPYTRWGEGCLSRLGCYNESREDGEWMMVDVKWMMVILQPPTPHSEFRIPHYPFFLIFL
jgi:hypothetical protein